MGGKSISEMLESYRVATSYGNQFPCLICGGALFENEVVADSTVEVLCSTDSLGQYVHGTVLEDQSLIFHGQRWCCHTCQMFVRSGRCPPMALTNLLTPAWLA